jgi:hypothetical protein
VEFLSTLKVALASLTVVEKLGFWWTAGFIQPSFNIKHTMKLKLFQLTLP